METDGNSTHPSRRLFTIAAASTADEHRPVAEIRIERDLAGSEERIAIDVKDPLMPQRHTTQMCGIRRAMSSVRIQSEYSAEAQL